MAQPDLTGRVPLVSVSTRDVGRTFCFDLADRGDDVGVHSNSGEDHATVVRRAGRERNVEALPLGADVTDADQIAALSETIEANEHVSGTNPEIDPGWHLETV